MEPSEGKLYRYLKIKASDLKVGDFFFPPGREWCGLVRRVVIKGLVHIDIPGDQFVSELDTLVKVLQPIRVSPTATLEEFNEENRNNG